MAVLVVCLQLRVIFSISSLWNRMSCILGLTAGHSPETVVTMVINILDDDGQPHRFDIEHSYYSPKFAARLMSPQQLAEQCYQKFGNTLHQHRVCSKSKCFKVRFLTITCYVCLKNLYFYFMCYLDMYNIWEVARTTAYKWLTWERSTN